MTDSQPQVSRDPFKDCYHPRHKRVKSRRLKKVYLKCVGCGRRCHKNQKCCGFSKSELREDEWRCDLCKLTAWERCASCRSEFGESDDEVVCCGCSQKVHPTQECGGRNKVETTQNKTEGEADSPNLCETCRLERLINELKIRKDRCHLYPKCEKAYLTYSMLDLRRFTTCYICGQKSHSRKECSGSGQKLHIPLRLFKVWFCGSCKDLEEPGNTARQSPRAGLKLCHLNVRSLKKETETFHFDLLRQIVESCDYDVVAVSETWFTKEIDQRKYHIKGYRLFRADRESRDNKQRGGGAALFVKYNLQPSEISLSVDKRCDAVFVKVRVEWSTEVGTSEGNGTCDVMLGAIYCPPEPDLKELEAVDVLTSIAKKSIEETPNIILTGDLNVNLNVNSPPVTQLKNCMQERGLTQLVQNPTRTQVTPKGRKATLIDHIWTTLETKFAPPIVHATLNFTDHDLISATFGR